MGDHEIIFYDGNCGLCHGFVRFVLARDKQQFFHFAPLQGQTFLDSVPKDAREFLPDTIVVQTQAETLLTRSTAILHVLSHLSSTWMCFAAIAGFIPTFLRDSIYDQIAHLRHRFWKKPNQLCPIVPETIKHRFHS